MPERRIFSKVSLVLIIISAVLPLSRHQPRADGIEVLTRHSQNGADLASPQSAFPDGDERASALDEFGQLPLSFIQNNGQCDEAVKYYEGDRGHSLFLTRDGMVFSIGMGGEASVLRISPVGKREQVEVVAEEPQAGELNILIGNDPAKWLTGIATYGKVRYRQVYDGVDLVFHGSRREIEFDFEVSPGADPGTIVLVLDGARKLEITPEGDLRAHLGEHQLVYRKPIAYQLVDGMRKGVSSSYGIEGDNRLCFEIGEYDRTKPLVIDPMVVYSTYLGGNFGDDGYAIAVDENGNTYVTGTTGGNFPLKNPSLPEGYGFVTKFSATGKSLIYSTTFGGWWTIPTALAVDGDGNAYVTGYTDSDEFPLKNPLQAELRGRQDAFVMKLSSRGKDLIYSTYLGGGLDEYGYGIAVDGDGNAYVTGNTYSNDFAIRNPVQAEPGGGACDAFVAKLDATGTSLVYSTYLGGGFSDHGKAVAVDEEGSAYVTGYTESGDFPVRNAFQSEYGGGYKDAFVTKLGPTGQTLVYSTLLGGNSYDVGQAIAVGTGGNAYVGGYTSSGDFPTKKAFQPAWNGHSSGFVTKLSRSGKSLVYSTYLSGSLPDVVYGLAVDSSGNACATGQTSSTDFPTKRPFQEQYGGGQFDAFFTKFGPTGKTLVISTYLGGISDDSGHGIALDGAGNAYVTGTTCSTDFPTKNPFQSGFGGTADAFVTKFRK